MPLTRRQQEILDFVREFTARWGYAPSLDEIQHRFRLGSVATVHKHIMNLEARGALRRQPHRSRALEVLPPPTMVSKGHGAVELPLLGIVAAGRPIEALEQPDTIDVPETMLGRGRTYVLRVRGDSMIDDCIQDGDYVIVEERQTAQNGEMVIACIEGREVTLKRLYRERGCVRLQPANPHHEPIYVNPEDLTIQGVVVGVMRRY